jgi:hypothetical protein
LVSKGSVGAPTEIVFPLRSCNRRVKTSERLISRP